MARVRKSELSFDALTLEGSLISPAKLAEVGDRKAGEQSDADYHIPKGLTLRDETARYFRIGQALFRELFAGSHPSQQATIRFTQELLRDVFGFTDVAVAGPKIHGDRTYIVSLEALSGRVPVVVVPPSDDLDHASPHLSHDRRRSAATSLQDWLNAEESTLWGICSNGEHLRLLRDNQSLTRPAYIEANLRQIFESEDFAGFAILWLIVHASRFGRASSPATDCALERWRESGSKEGLAARERLSVGVKEALLALGNGFVSNPANSDLRDRLTGGRLPLPDFFNELLRLVYRLIFLLAAEDRGLLHAPDAPDAARKLYTGGYRIQQQEGISGGSSLTLSVEPELLNLDCGESSYEAGCGSEAWTTMSWSASLGERTDNDGTWDESWLGEPYFDKSTSNDLAECTISIEDADNDLLCDDGSEEQDNDEDVSGIQPNR
jgi:hypothetical protein